jgi:osmoprotectant transport system substrate-binding protein
MRKVRAKLLRLVGLATVLGTILVVVGCGGGGGGGAAGEGDLSGASLKVGSKEFTEQLVLGQITKQALEAAGASVTYNDLAGTEAARSALTSGEIDMYWDYTGTGWIVFLDHTDPIPDPKKQFEAVAEEDLKKNNIKWLVPAPANNTYAFAVREEAYEDLGVKQISDFNRLLQESPDKATLCVGTEFATRDDGLPGVEKAYNIEFPDGNVTRMDEGLVYQAIDNGERCNFGEVFQTDGRIAALDLKLIEDNKNFFPNYNPALTMRQEVFEKYPQIKEVMAPISDKLTTQTLQKLNAKVDVQGQLPEQVAEDWLEENGFI